MVDTSLVGSGRRLWLTETIRLSEERWGPYEDSEIVRGLRHAEPADALSTAIEKRNLALARREGLDRLAAHWRDNAWLAALGGMVVAVVAGCIAALAALGDGSRPVNLFWALGGLLGMHIFMLSLWLASLRWTPRAGALGRLVMAVATRASHFPPLAAVGRTAPELRPPAAALLPRALAGLLQRAGMLRALLGAFSHAWWLLALFSAFVTLIALLATRRYEFVWETTLLSSHSFVILTQTLGWLPGLLGFAAPDAATIRASDGLQALGPAGQVMWSQWLLGCVFVYGVLARLLALAASLWFLRRRRPHLSLDLALPGLAVLADRLRPASQRLGVTDSAPEQLPCPGMPATPAEAGDAVGASMELAAGFTGRRHEPDQRILAGVELPDDTAWPPAPLTDQIIDAGVLDHRRQRNALLDHFASNPPARLLVVCDGAQTPDRGTIGLVAQMARAAGAARIGLLGAAENGRHGHWRERLIDAGIPAASVCTDVAAGIHWLETAGTQSEEELDRD